jgi:hypothetical protein
MTVQSCEITVTTYGSVHIVEISYDWNATGWLAHLTMRLQPGQVVVASADQGAVM